jgi:hypothetical protein
MVNIYNLHNNGKRRDHPREGTTQEAGSYWIARFPGLTPASLMTHNNIDRRLLFPAKHYIATYVLFEELCECSCPALKEPRRTCEGNRSLPPAAPTGNISPGGMATECRRDAALLNPLAASLASTHACSVVPEFTVIPVRDAATRQACY